MSDKVVLTPEIVFPWIPPKHLLETFSSKERYSKLIRELMQNEENPFFGSVEIIGKTKEIKPVDRVMVAYSDRGLEYLTGFVADSFQCSLWVPEPNVILTYFHKPESKELQEYIRKRVQQGE